MSKETSSEINIYTPDIPERFFDCANCADNYRKSFVNWEQVPISVYSITMDGDCGVCRKPFNTTCYDSAVTDGIN